MVCSLCINQALTKVQIFPFPFPIPFFFLIISKIIYIRKTMWYVALHELKHINWLVEHKKNSNIRGMMLSYKRGVKKTKQLLRHGVDCLMGPYFLDMCFGSFEIGRIKKQRKRQTYLHALFCSLHMSIRFRNDFSSLHKWLLYLL